MNCEFSVNSHSRSVLWCIRSVAQPQQKGLYSLITQETTMIPTKCKWKKVPVTYIRGAVQSRQHHFWHTLQMTEGFCYLYSWRCAVPPTSLLTYIADERRSLLLIFVALCSPANITPDIHCKRQKVPVTYIRGAVQSRQHYSWRILNPSLFLADTTLPTSTAVMNIQIYWDVTLCRPVCNYRRF